MIKHTVTFKLKDSISAIEKELFFTGVDSLKSITGVKKFEVLKRIDNDDNAEYAIFMAFENNEIFRAYTSDPIHLRFIKNYWLKFVETFKEMDFDII